MTTLAEDHDSWKASSLIRRDFRHSHDGQEVSRHVGKRKNGRRWCRGKPGRAHAPVLVTGPPGRWGYDVEVCSACGKKLVWHWRSWI